GGSYGATAAQVYIARHGGHVAAAVLDGASLLDVPLFERMPLATQRSFDRLAARCASDVFCHAAFPDLELDLRTLVGGLRPAPVRDGTGPSASAWSTPRGRFASRYASRRPPRGSHSRCTVRQLVTTATCSTAGRHRWQEREPRPGSSCTGRSSAARAGHGQMEPESVAGR